MPQDVKHIMRRIFIKRKSLTKSKHENIMKKLVETNFKAGMNRSFNKVYTMREVYPGMGAFRKYS